MRSKLSRLSELTPLEWLLGAQMVVLCWALRAGLLFMPFPRLVELILRGASTPGLKAFPLLHRRADARRLARLADMAAGAAPATRGRCLPRSLLLLWLMRARDVSARIRLGVRRHDGALRAHAWVEADGVTIAEHPDIAVQFALLLTLRGS